MLAGTSEEDLVGNEADQRDDIRSKGKLDLSLRAVECLEFLACDIRHRLVL